MAQLDKLLTLEEREAEWLLYEEAYNSLHPDPWEAWQIRAAMARHGDSPEACAALVTDTNQPRNEPAGAKPQVYFVCGHPLERRL
jgi:hypothetical protein